MNLPASSQEPDPQPTLETTPDGSVTVYSPRYAQHYHSKHGAQSQSQIVYLEGTRTHLHPDPHVLEVGFGVGLNFLTTLQSVLERKVKLHYIAFEFDPVQPELLEQAQAQHPFAENVVWQDVLTRWGDSFSYERDGIRLEVICEDVTETPLPSAWATAVYLDGFSPAANPEVWSESFCATVAAAMRPEAWLSTYSSSGQVRRALAAAGLEVHKQSGFDLGLLGKREFVVAQKK
jgi:tRNA U34 5-methylaminomethyl-2-thiouridine-forming methyltransferase MnmC